MSLFGPNWCDGSDLQIRVDQLLVDSIKNGTADTVIKQLPKTKLATDIQTSHSHLNALAVKLQDRYPQLRDWGFLNTSANG